MPDPGAHWPGLVRRPGTGRPGGSAGPEENDGLCATTSRFPRQMLSAIAAISANPARKAQFVVRPIAYRMGARATGPQAVVTKCAARPRDGRGRARRSDRRLPTNSRMKIRSSEGAGRKERRSKGRDKPCKEARPRFGLETNQQRPIEDEIAPSGPGSPPRQARALRPLSAAGMPKPGGEGPIHQNVRRASIFPRPRGLRKGSVVAPKSRSRFRV